MFYLDSWVWIEFFSRNEAWKQARDILAKLERNKGVLSTIALMEVKYVLKRKFEKEKANRVLGVILSFDNLLILPVSTKVAIYAADLREKYYQKREREFSYGDGVHLATAVLADCKKLYSGDSDFRDIDEIETCII